MYGKFIKYFYHKQMTIDEEKLFPHYPSREEVIDVVKSLGNVKFLDTRDDIIFVYRGIRYKAVVIQIKDAYTVDAKEF